MPSSDIDVEAEVSVTTFLYGDGNDEGLVNKEASPLCTMGSYLRREANRGVMTNETSAELLGAGIKIMEGMVFLLSNSLTVDAATVLSSSQGGGVGGMWGVRCLPHIQRRNAACIRPLF